MITFRDANGPSDTVHHGHGYHGDRINCYHGDFINCYHGDGCGHWSGSEWEEIPKEGGDSKRGRSGTEEKKVSKRSYQKNF